MRVSINCELRGFFPTFANINVRVYYNTVRGSIIAINSIAIGFAIWFDLTSTLMADTEIWIERSIESSLTEGIRATGDRPRRN